MGIVDIKVLQKASANFASILHLLYAAYQIISTGTSNANYSRFLQLGTSQVVVDL